MGNTITTKLETSTMTKESLISCIRDSNFNNRPSELPIEFRDDKEVVLIAIDIIGTNAFKYASLELQNNRDFVLEVVMWDKNVLEMLSTNLQDDFEIVNAAMSSPTQISSCTCALGMASPRLRSDRDLVLNAIKNVGLEIQYANPCFLNDEEIVLAAFKNRGDDGSQYYGKPHTIEEYISPKMWKRIQKVGKKGEIIDMVTNKLTSFLTNLENPAEYLQNRRRLIDSELRYEEEWRIRNKNYHDQWKLEIEKWKLRILKQQQDQKDIQYEGYRALRLKIEQMPIHERWKSNVFSKCGNICQMCGLGSNLQIHHRDSFYSILKQNGVDSIEKAFECKPLWEVDNGEVLCKECHDKMESSKTFIRKTINN